MQRNGKRFGLNPYLQAHKGERMKTKDVKERFEGAANKREIFDIIEEIIIDELEKAIKPQDLIELFHWFTEQELKDINWKDIHITISPRFKNCVDRREGTIIKKYCVGYDIRVMEGE